MGSVNFMPEVIRFYRSNGKYGFLSNLFKCCVRFEGRDFKTAEHAYQFGKPKKIEVAEWINNAPEPHLVAAIAHALLVYDIRPDWSSIKIGRMEAVLRAKFSQNEPLKLKLLETKGKMLIEDSKIDNFWGVGKKGRGKNMLGKLLMKIREELL